MDRIVSLFSFCPCKICKKENREAGRSVSLTPVHNEELQRRNEELQRRNEELQRTVEALQRRNEELMMANELLKKYFHKEADVTLDLDTAHPRLEVSEGGKCVRDTGAVRNVPNNEKRFDSQIFVLASEGFASGKHYWEVDTGKKSNWELGVAHEDVCRKGKITLSPKNGYWVIGLTDGKDYWARTDPWTRLTVSGKPSKIGMFLDMSAGKLSFYNVEGKFVFYTFTGNFEEKLYPFFSTGSAVTRDTEPLKISSFEKQ